MNIIPKEDLIVRKKTYRKKIDKSNIYRKDIKEVNKFDDLMEVRKGRKVQYSYYREAIKNYVEKWKAKINESFDHQTEIRIRYIRKLLGPEFNDKSDITIYSRIKDILLEYGIKVKLFHHYGARLLLTNSDIILSELELNRIRREQTTRNAGYNKYFDYHKETLSWKKTGRKDCDKNIDCPKYLGTFLAEIVLRSLFDGEKNPIYAGVIGSGSWDWKTKDGMLIKHCAASLKKGVKKDYETGKEYNWEGWQWGILGNNVPDYFLLIGYGENREDLDILNMWLVPSKDIVRSKQFWDRESFTIRTDKNKQIIEMQEYEFGISRLEKVREVIKMDNSNNIRIDDNEFEEDFSFSDIEFGNSLRKEISDWYRAYFR